MNFGAKLKSIRKCNQFTQEDMAEALFTTQGNYSQYENNLRSPSLDFLHRLIGRFGVDANWLLSKNCENKLKDSSGHPDGLALQFETPSKLAQEMSLLENKLDEILSILNQKNINH